MGYNNSYIKLWNQPSPGGNDLGGAVINELSAEGVPQLAERKEGGGDRPGRVQQAAGGVAAGRRRAGYGMR